MLTVKYFFKSAKPCYVLLYGFEPLFYHSLCVYTYGYNLHMNAAEVRQESLSRPPQSDFTTV